MSADVTVTNAAPVRKTTRKKKNQLPVAMVVLVLVIVFAVFVGLLSPKLAMGWIFGIAFGVVLQKSRFCFTAAFRDPVLTGGTSLTKAVLTAIGIALVGFGIIQYITIHGGKGVLGSINPAGIHVAIGATMFGIGAVISGGCASGTLMRVGEGFMMQWLSLIFFVVGSLWGARDFGWWQQQTIASSPKVHLPSALGWTMAFILQLAVLAGLYFLADWWGKRKTSE